MQRGCLQIRKGAGWVLLFILFLSHYLLFIVLFKMQRRWLQMWKRAGWVLFSVNPEWQRALCNQTHSVEKAPFSAFPFK